MYSWQSENNTTDGFKIYCEKCGGNDCDIEQVSPPYWDDGYALTCANCKRIATATKVTAPRYPKGPNSPENVDEDLKLDE